MSEATPLLPLHQNNKNKTKTKKPQKKPLETTSAPQPQPQPPPPPPPPASHPHFPGWGTYDQPPLHIDDATLKATAQDLENRKHPHEMLDEWAASSICCNDVLSSFIYSIGFVGSFAGKLAPVCMLLVGTILYLFRSVYGEAISSYPCNGGSYNLLINTSSKAIAASAACLSLIAYIATGVVSAVTASNYLHAIFPNMWLDVGGTASVLLTFFAAVVCMGLKESSRVAMTICTFHIATLCFLLFLGLIYLSCNKLGELPSNLQQPYPDVMLERDTGSGAVGAAGKERIVDIPGSFGSALLFGFSAGMLGVSGFETSSQYVESQKPGVFLKTLRNMQLGVVLFNPLLSLLAISVLPLEEVVAYSETVLERVSHVMGDWLQEALGLGSPSSSTSTDIHTHTYLNLGRALGVWVSLDAFVVLSGAVLTAYVGIDGLIYQLALDGCLPSFLLQKNAWRDTDHYIIGAYLLLALSQVYLFDADIDALAGVYAFSFLSVMCIFAIGTGMLKVKRAELPREVVAPWWHVIGGFLAVAIAFCANLRSKPQYLVYFALYLCGVGLVTLLMFQRVRLLKLVLFFLVPFPSLHAALREYLTHTVRCDRAVFFAKTPDLYILNKAMLYVRRNETTVHSLVIVHCHDENEQQQKKAKTTPPRIQKTKEKQTHTHTQTQARSKGGGGERMEELGEGDDEEEAVAEAFAKQCEMFDHMYPSIKVSFLKVCAPFSPALVEILSQRLEVEKNLMFITCPDAQFRHRIHTLGGLRVITH